MSEHSPTTEAAREISNVMSKYELYYDKKELDGLLKLFTEDCSVRYDHFGSLDGLDEMESYLKEYFSGELVVQDSFHMLANPWIEVNGKEATGKWHFFGAYLLDDVGATWFMGFYDNQFEKIDDDWKISSLDWESKYTTPHSDGWDKTPMILDD
jgi:hypothetical protein